MSKLVLLPAPVVPMPTDQVIVVDDLVMDGYRDVPLFQIRISKTNRKRFDTGALDDLAASAREVGIMQPILLRPAPVTDGEPQPYEIVAGERRFRAAVMAQLVAIPARIIAMSDEQALRIQLLENVQREDPHPLEEAEGYQQLMHGFGFTVEQIMETVKQSRTYIYNRLKLCELCISARDAFFDGLLTAETGQLIARIPNPKLQVQAVSEITKPTDKWKHGDGPMTYREAREHIRRHFTLNLQTATFPIKDATLTDAGSCIECPKRAGNQPDFEGDSASADVCTDPACFADKRGAQHGRERTDAKSKGIAVIAGEQARKIMPQSYGDLRGGYIDLDKQLYLQKGGTTTYRKLLGKKLPPVVLLEQPHNSELLTIAKVDDIEAALTAAGKPIPETERSRNLAQKEREKEQAAAAKIEREYRRRLFMAVRAAATPELTPAEVRAAAMSLLKQCHTDVLPFVATVYGWDSSEYQAGHDGAKWISGTMKLERLVDALDVEQAAVLIRDLVWAQDLFVYTHTAGNDKPTRLLAVAEQFNVNAAQIRKDVKRDAEAKATKKPKASKTKAATPAPAQLELPQPDMIDLASVATTDALRKFISEHPERLSDLSETLLDEQPHRLSELEAAALAEGYIYKGGWKKAPNQVAPQAQAAQATVPPVDAEQARQADAPAPENPSETANAPQRAKLQLKAKPAAPVAADGPVVKIKKNRTASLPANDGLPTEMEYPV
jgi:ParB/RepB/Spo0J family partition protein